MGKGDATWKAVKTVLGWTLDTVAKTISLPAHRLSRLHELLLSMSDSKKRISLKKWQQLLGELRSMATAIPAAIGPFSALQEALTHKTTGGHRNDVHLT
jgi:prolyl-tRNA editing enzyme YbaK/EbsC (Cys-tRNA(Pro) deacylase)